MTTLQTHQTSGLESLFTDYAYRFWMTLTLALGMHLHLIRLQLGDDDLFFTRIFTPGFDMLFALPMLIASVTGLLSARRMMFRNNIHKVISRFTLFYVTASLLLHVPTFFTHSTALVRLFPRWYSYVFMVMSSVLMAGLWLLRFRARGRAS
jgi:hypothetical protein